MLKVTRALVGALALVILAASAPRAAAQSTNAGSQQPAAPADKEPLRYEDTASVEAKAPAVPPPADTATKLETNVRDLPVSVSVVSGRLAAEQAGLVLGDALKNASGVNVGTGFGIFDHWVVRGFDTLDTGSGPGRRGGRPRGGVLPALQRAADRGAQGAGRLRVGRGCSFRDHSGRAQEPGDRPLRRPDARLRELRDVRGRGRRQRRFELGQGRVPAERDAAGNGRLPRRARGRDRRVQPGPRLAPRRAHARGALVRVPEQRPVPRLGPAVRRRLARRPLAGDLLPVRERPRRPGPAPLPGRRTAAAQRHVPAARQALLLEARLDLERHADRRRLPLPARLPDLRAAHAGAARRQPAPVRQPARAGGVVPDRLDGARAGHRLRGQPARATPTPRTRSSCSRST